MSGYDPTIHTGRLKRLPRYFYTGVTFIHWTNCIAERRIGSLTPLHHFQVRELLCHTLARFRLLCPAYSLMPEHSHMVWIGWHSTSDQLKAMTAFRTGLAALLQQAGGYGLERQAFDNVLSERERTQDAFPLTAQYVLRNPERKGLVKDWRDYPFLGAVVPGFPALDPRDKEYWPNFWRIYRWIVREGGGSA